MKVLIVDDEQEICILLKNMLEAMECTTESANTILEGKIKYQENEPDLVFLDINLTDGDGVQAIPDFKTHGQKLVMISAYDLPVDQERALKAGADIFISKPFTRKHIIDTIHQLTINHTSASENINH